MMIDLAIIMYVLTGSIYIYGFCIFLYWWVCKKAASEVFGYVTFLQLGIAIMMGFNLWAKYMAARHDALESVVTSKIWPHRLWIVLLIGIILNYRMTRRILKNKE